MGSLLIKLFIKNPDKTDDPDVREQYGKFAGVVGIVSNPVSYTHLTLPTILRV